MPKPKQLKTFDVEVTFEVLTLFEVEAYTEEEAKELAMALIKEGELGLSFIQDKQVTKVREC